MKNIFYISIIAVLLTATIFFWHKSSVLSRKLELIQKRIETSKKTALKKERPGRYRSAKLAIVIDDWGYNLNNLHSALELDAPVTLSILPNLPYSKKVAEAATRNGLEVILHLPLEPHEDLPLEKETIITGMPDEEIKRLLEKAVHSVPGLKGISNHMGSKATEDEKVMSIIFKRMKKDKLYFLDSLVTGDSVCAKLAPSAGIRFAQRSVFLDNEMDVEYIKNQIKEAASQAQATGSAIGIGHDREPTLAAIAEMLPALKKMGIKIVPASELAK